MKVEAASRGQVVVYIDRKAAQEFTDDNDPRSNASAGVSYLEAMPGSTFSVDARLHKSQLAGGNDAIRAAIFIDGVQADKRTAYKSRHDGSIHFVFKGTQLSVGGQRARRQYKFSDLETDDQTAAGIPRAKFQKLGEIEVRLWAVRLLARPRPKRGPPVSDYIPLVTGIVPEKCLKGKSMSCAASLGDVDLRQGYGNYVKTSYQEGQQPYASFIFKYRTRRDLQIEGIIPRDTTPIPLEKRDVNTLSLDEARERIRLHDRAQQERDAQIKAEKRKFPTLIKDEDQNLEGEGVTVKHESDRTKRRRLGDECTIETIDLTGD